MVLEECQQVMVLLSHTEVLVLQVREMMLEGYVWLHLIAVILYLVSEFLLFPFLMFVYLYWWLISNTTKQEYSPRYLSIKSFGNFNARPFCFLILIR